MPEIKKRKDGSLKEVVPVEADKIAVLDKQDVSKTSIALSYGGSESEGSDISDIEGYDETLEWTEEEESKVRRKIDLHLLPFMLLMAFVLNMDRTNHCKSTQLVLTSM